MSEIELIAAALAAGALGGTTSAANDAVRDAYAALRNLLRGRFAGRAAAQQALEASEPEPDRWIARIGDDLSASGADRDDAVLAAARKLLTEAGRQGGSSKYSVNVHDSRVVVVGDGTKTTVTFND